ncbi:MAG: autotransporter outer membrane beta-barrel domain-containing protein, partial [Chlamydiia bacterium]|nr:autotransporter outer membrane beta-barrel domain-containing protein [Chlamydiia bacterium]
LNPSARIDYIYVLQEENKEFLDKKSSLHVQDSSDSFMQTRLSLELKREVYKPKLGFVVPSLIFAWNHFIPLSTGSYSYSISGCDKVVGAERLLKPWDTLSYGGRLALIFKKGFYLSLDYELSHGTSQIQHKGTVRASLSW